MDLEELFGSGGSMEKSGWEPWAEGKEMVEALLAGVTDTTLSRFKVGDIIHPKEGSTKKGRGVPHYVVERYEVRFDGKGDSGEPVNSHDMLIAVMPRENVLFFYRDHSREYEIFEEQLLLVLHLSP